MISDVSEASGPARRAVCPVLAQGYVWKGRKCQLQTTFDPVIERQVRPGFFGTLYNTWVLMRGCLWQGVKRAQSEKMAPNQARHVSYIHTVIPHIAISTYSPINEETLKLPRYGEGISGSRGWDTFPVIAGWQNIIMAEGETRKRFLRVLTPLFQGDYVKKNHFEKLKEESLATVQTLLGRKVALWPNMMRHSCRAIGATYLGIAPAKHDALLQALQTLLKIHFNLAQMRPWELFCNRFRHYFKRWDIDGYYGAHRVLETTIQESLAKPTRPQFLTSLVQNLTMQEVIDNLKTFYFAGTETTASLLATAIILIARDSTLQSALREELRQAQIHEVADLKSEHLDWKSSPLVGLKSVILEALRLVPPIPGQVRKFTADRTASGFHFQKDTTLIIDHSAHNRDERNFESPNQVCPERFLDEETGGIVEEAAADVLRCFGGGVTRCPGQSFALFETQTLLVALLLSSKMTTEQGSISIVKGASAHLDADVQVSFHPLSA